MSRSPRLGMWLALGCALLPALAEARPGGGESYSGGGGSSSGGGGSGGDGDGGLIFLLLRLWFQLVFRYPVVGVPLTVIVVIWLIRQRRRAAANPRTWDSAPSAPRPVAPAEVASGDLEALRTIDPDFSPVLFEDFAFALYARAHQARSQPAALEALAPYLSEPARRHLAGRLPAGEPVSAVVVGALRVTGVRPADATVQSAVTLEIEAHLTVGGNLPGAQYVRERWKLVRRVGVRSKPPGAAASFQCPNCGAPFTGQAGGGRCEFCGEVVTDGRFDWSVQSIDLLRAVARPPALTSTVEEVGTSWPTVFHPELAARRAALLQDDPATTDAALRARLERIYAELNASWTGLDLAPVRPFVSDSLFDYLQYWIDAYRQQGLRNVLEGMHVVDVVLAKVGRDRYFDALTFRLWGSGRDYTVRQSTGDVLSGDPKADRAYSEYWTLIRGAGVRGAPRDDSSCPNCGAPLQVNMAGVCAHCSSKITRGDFDWVLSKIEQDDAYSG